MTCDVIQLLLRNLTNLTPGITPPKEHTATLLATST